MTSKQFFLERIDPAASRARLEGAEHHHLARVARIKAGERIWVFDREGKRYLAEVEVIGKDRTSVRLVGPAEDSHAGVGITLGQALIKPANMDLVVRKASELGVATLVPLTTVRSLHPFADAASRLSRRGREAGLRANPKLAPAYVPGSRGVDGLGGVGGKKIERWRKIALEAAKQSRRSTPTSIGPYTPVEGFAAAAEGARRLYLSEGGGTPLGEVLTGPGGSSAASAVPPDVVLLTGPEGGWTEAEETMLMKADFEAVSLGRIILRAETATIIAVGMIAHFWGG